MLHSRHSCPSYPCNTSLFDSCFHILTTISGDNDQFQFAWVFDTDNIMKMIKLTMVDMLEHWLHCTYSWDYQTDHILRISACPWPMELHLYPLLFYHIEHWTPAAWWRFLQHWSTFNNTSVTLILSQKGSHYFTSTNTSSTNSQFNNLIWIQPIQNNVALQRYDKYKFCPLVSILQLQLRIISS